MSIETDVTFWKQITQWMWAPVTALVALIWSMLNRRIDEIKVKADSAVTKSDFAIHLAQVESNRQNYREDIKELFEKHAAMRELIDLKVDSAASRVERKVDDLRKDFNEGLRSIRDEIRSR